MRSPPDYVNRASGLELRQFKWLGDDGLVGEIPRGWNHLVGHDGTVRRQSLWCITPPAGRISSNVVTVSAPAPSSLKAAESWVLKKNYRRSKLRDALQTDWPGGDVATIVEECLAESEQARYCRSNRFPFCPDARVTICSSRSD